MGTAPDSDGGDDGGDDVGDGGGDGTDSGNDAGVDCSSELEEETPATCGDGVDVLPTVLLLDEDPFVVEEDVLSTKNPTNRKRKPLVIF